MTTTSLRPRVTRLLLGAVLLLAGCLDWTGYSGDHGDGGSKDGAVSLVDLTASPEATALADGSAILDGDPADERVPDLLAAGSDGASGDSDCACWLDLGEPADLPAGPDRSPLLDLVPPPGSDLVPPPGSDLSPRLDLGPSRDLKREFTVDCRTTLVNCNLDGGYGDHCAAADNTGGCAADWFAVWCNRRNSSYPGLWNSYRRRWVDDRCDGEVFDNNSGPSYFHCTSSTGIYYVCVY